VFQESLRRVLQEKLEAVRKLSDLETSLSNTEDNCTHLKNMCELAQQELERLASKHEETEKDVDTLKQKLEVSVSGRESLSNYRVFPLLENMDTFEMLFFREMSLKISLFNFVNTEFR
jgi:chromosome segregation ATPase